MRGRIYISEQGINAQYGGVRRDAEGYARWLADTQPLFKVGGRAGRCESGCRRLWGGGQARIACVTKLSQGTVSLFPW